MEFPPLQYQKCSKPQDHQNKMQDISPHPFHFIAQPPVIISIPTLLSVFENNCTQHCLIDSCICVFKMWSTLSLIEHVLYKVPVTWCGAGGPRHRDSARKNKKTFIEASRGKKNTILEEKNRGSGKTQKKKKKTPSRGRLHGTRRVDGLASSGTTLGTGKDLLIKVHKNTGEASEREEQCHMVLWIKRNDPARGLWQEPP